MARIANVRPGCVWLVMMLMASPVLAGEIRHDVADIQYTNLAAQPQFSGVATTDFFPPTAASFISSNWLLTAGHLAGITNITYNGVDYPVIQNFAHPNWTGDQLGGTDLRLIQIGPNAVTGLPAHPSQVYQIYRGPVLDQVFTNVGYGDTGNGQAGYAPGTAGTKRAGNLVIRSFIEKVAVNNYQLTRSSMTTVGIADFISPTTGLSTILTDFNGNIPVTVPAQPLEYMLGARDSGSPLLIQDNGVWKIAGVASFQGTLDPNPPGGFYGELSGFGLVDDFSFNWIVQQTAIPEPTTIAFTALVVFMGLGAGWYRYRQSRRLDQELVE